MNSSRTCPPGPRQTRKAEGSKGRNRTNKRSLLTLDRWAKPSVRHGKKLCSRNSSMPLRGKNVGSLSPPFIARYMAKIFALKTVAITDLRDRKSVLLLKVSVPPSLLRGSYVEQSLACGKPNCRCRRGQKHGPFHYLVQCLAPGNVQKFLLKTAEQRRQAKAAIRAYTELQNQIEELSQINAELIRRGETLDDTVQSHPHSCST